MSYDRSLTVFSPDGSMKQLDYAMEAVDRGHTVVGLKTKDVVVLAYQKKSVQKLQTAHTMRKIFNLDEHLAMSFAGLTADARVLANKARLECQSHRLTVEDPASVEYIARYIAGVCQKYTQSGGVRPFGVSTLVIGWDSDKRPKLFQTFPSGNHSSWKAVCIGKLSKAVNEFLEKNYSEDLSKEEAIKFTAKALLEVAQGGGKNVDVMFMDKSATLQVLPEEEVEKLCNDIEKEKEAENEKKKKERGLVFKLLRSTEKGEK